MGGGQCQLHCHWPVSVCPSRSPSPFLLSNSSLACRVFPVAPSPIPYSLSLHLGGSPDLQSCLSDPASALCAQPLEYSIHSYHFILHELREIFLQKGRKKGRKEGGEERSPICKHKALSNWYSENLPPKGGFSAMPNDFTESKQLFSITRFFKAFKTFLQEMTQND